MCVNNLSTIGIVRGLVLKECALRAIHALLALCVCGFAARLQAQNEERFSFAVDTSYHEERLLAALSAPAKTLTEYETKLQTAGTLMLRSRSEEIRQAAADSLRIGFGRALASPEGRAYSFSKVKSASIIADSSSAWRLITWQHFVNDSTYRYDGFFVSKNAAIPPVRLIDAAQQEGVEGDFELMAEQWYGCVYYAVQPFQFVDGRAAWVLFGYDADGYHHRRKVADVLSLDRQGMPRFGAEVFVGSEGQPERVRSRIILEYRTDARVGLRFDPELGGIVHDRLVTGPPVRPGMPPSYVPDGSYDGFTLDEDAGLWRYREEYFDRVISQEALLPAPILGGEEAYDLFGRPKKKRGR